MLSLATGQSWSCSPIEPGEEGSATTAKATVEGVDTGTNPSWGGGDVAATTGGETGSATGGAQTTSFPELTIPTALTDKDKEAGLKYGFALVCETLYGADKNEDTLVVSTSEHRGEFYYRPDSSVISMNHILQHDLNKKITIACPYMLNLLYI